MAFRVDPSTSPASEPNPVFQNVTSWLGRAVQWFNDYIAPLPGKICAFAKNLFDRLFSSSTIVGTLSMLVGAAAIRGVSSLFGQRTPPKEAEELEERATSVGFNEFPRMMEDAARGAFGDRAYFAARTFMSPAENT